jgi:hypothetical protein
MYTSTLTTSISLSVHDSFAIAARGTIPEDLKDEHYTILADLAPTVADPEMRARLCDLLWVVKRNYLMVKAAVPAYLGTLSSSRGARVRYSVGRLVGALRIGLV